MNLFLNNEYTDLLGKRVRYVVYGFLNDLVCKVGGCESWYKIDIKGITHIIV